MASTAENILKHSNHATVKEVAGHIASGLTFGDILAKYNLTDSQLAKIHQYKSSITTALKMGTSFEEVINNHFPNQATRNRIIGIYNKQKSK
ncbi:MAG: hypothetical protein JKY02_00675 [Flavobacteriaceae bacterium]|nr:hypothetical protein [Flavobacteriaceae bacterium]